jgi:serine/threonine-protein kinase ULK/ATG1
MFISSSVSHVTSHVTFTSSMAIIAGKFKVEAEIGRGAYATVYSAKVVHDFPPLKPGDGVALKSIALSRLQTQKEQGKPEIEIELMTNLNHPNIVKLYGVERFRNYCILVMERCDGGDLIRYLQSHPDALDEPTIRFIARQIGEGLNYLHSHSILHRDLKPHNILLTDTGDRPTLKIADFGFARLLSDTELTASICGSPMYMAPEIQFGGKYSRAVDLWSLGAILFEMITRKTIFPEAKTQYELTQSLRTRGVRPISLPLEVSASPELRDLVSALLTVDPDSRITAAQFLMHPFFGAETKTAFRRSERQFSFMSADRSVDEVKAEMLLCEARETADLVAEQISATSGLPSILALELLVRVCDLLVDFLAEYRSMTHDASAVLQNSIVETIRLRATEAERYARGRLDRVGCGASRYLLEKGTECAREAAEAELAGDSRATVQYQRALAMLRPIVYSRKSDDFTSSVRELFVQIVKRRDSLAAIGSLFPG